jgi:hypothetical protein
MRNRMPQFGELDAAAVSRRSFLRGAVGLGVAGMAIPIIGRTQTTSAQFDFYISPTGNNANAGTQASPWAITALSSKAAIAGKRVGLLDGTYVLTGTGNGNGGWILNLPYGGPSAGQPTVIAAVNPRAAVITTNNGGSYPQATATMFGINADNITLDGLKFYQGSFGAVLVSGNNCTIKNCHLEDFDLNRYASYAATYAGDNIGAICSASSSGYSNLRISNCYVKHVRNGNRSQNEACVGPFYSLYNAVIEFCTITDAASGIYWKTASGITVRNCFISQCNWPLNGWSSYNSGNQTKQPSVAYNNICIGNQMFQSGANTTSQTDLTLYNNTLIGGSGSGAYGALGVFNDVTRQAAYTATFYNNIWYFPSSTAAIYVWESGSGAPTAASSFSGHILDYNSYPANFSITDRAGNTSYSSLAAWQSSMAKDTHSSTANPLLVNASGTTPADFKLQATSPLKGAGRVGGVASGAAVDIGAWGGATQITQIGNDFSATASSTQPVPDAPVLTVS